MAEASLLARLEKELPLWEQWVSEGKWEPLSQALAQVNRERERRPDEALPPLWLERLNTLLEAMVTERNRMGQRLGGVNQSKRSMGGYRPARDGAYYLDVSE